MRILWMHPGIDALATFATCSPDQHVPVRVTRHLERCAMCRDQVATLRRLSSAVGPALGEIDPIWRRVLAERAAGRRSILPVHDGQPVRARWGLGAAAAAGIAAIGLLVFAPGQRVVAGSESGTLTFDPATPKAGERTSVRYHAPQQLADYEQLVLRARYRRPTDEAYHHGSTQLSVAVLTRARGGVYRGTVTLPDSVVYAAFAVEDSAGEHVDARGGRLWEILVAGPDGKPAYGALRQKYRDLMGRDWEAAFQAVREMTALYPDRPSAWQVLQSFERWVLGPAAAESLEASHAAQFRRLHARLTGDPGVPPEEIIAMRYYAPSEDTVAKRLWRERFEREVPLEYPWRLFWQENDISRRYADTVSRYARYLVEVEPVWRKVEPLAVTERRLFIGNALNHAFAAKDEGAIQRWVDRYRRYVPGASEGVGFWARRMMESPNLRPGAADWLRAELARRDQSPDADRPLERSRTEHRREGLVATIPLLATLAEAILADGDTAAAVDTLTLAAARGWSPDVYRAIARIALARGDSATATAALARVASDPATPSEFVDTVHRTLGRRVEGSEWHRELAAARDEMRRRTLAFAQYRPLQESRVTARDGEVRTFSELADGVTMVVFWSRFCGPALQRARDIATTGRRLQDAGARVLVVTDNLPSAAMDSVLSERGLAVPVYYDRFSEAKRAFANFATPEYHVLDGPNRVVFYRTTLEAVPRQVAVLLASSTASGALQERTRQPGEP